MKCRMIWIFLAGILVGFAPSGLYKHFVTDQIMDGGNGMENPDAAFPLDGDHTYVDNSVLWPVLEGIWEGENGRWQAVIGEESGIVLRADRRDCFNVSAVFHLPPAGKGRLDRA